MSAIRDVRLRLVYDSRAHPTVEATVETNSGAIGKASAPSGASTGAHEVQAFPTGGVPEALTTFSSVVRSRLIGLDIGQQLAIDGALHEADGTPNFAHIGGNTATAISVASALCAATELRKPLWHVLRRPQVDGKHFPAIVGNCINGGKHAIGGPDIQEFIAYSSAPDPKDSIRAAIAVHQAIGEALHKKLPKHALGRGDEGGWVAPLGNVESLEVLADACTKVRDELHLPVHPGLDFAASEFFGQGRYHYRDQTVDADGQLGFVEKLIDRFDLHYVEDPFDQEAFDSFAALTRAVGTKVPIVGDDLYTTAKSRVEMGVAKKSTNAVLIKVNQIGTISDTLATVDYCRAQSLETVTSHRSGEVPEGWLAQIAVGLGSAALKCGVLGGERVAKLNELLRLGAAAEHHDA